MEEGLLKKNKESSSAKSTASKSDLSAPEQPKEEDKISNA